MEGRKNVPMCKILFEIDTIELTLHREPTDWTVLYDEYKRLSIDTAPILSLRRALSQATSVRCREKNVAGDITSIRERDLGKIRRKIL